ncbi:MAG: translation initiation factor IF-2 subunit gamma [Candidatus Micrarchaeota archaeon]|nr:translation initiation factor IF-2 subunit gamma [Candidatus Micrarchaeota archaeon]
MDVTKQSVLNIGTLGHIDHGKTSLTRAITHMWTDKHSESIKRNMTIKLGYADAIIKKCKNCDGPESYTTGDKCVNCSGEAVPQLRISMLDAPGHETLMATAIAGSSVIDAILFVISATEPCPMQQTKEHLMIINLLGLKNAIVVQSKVDIVGPEKARQHYQQIKDFLKGSVIEHSPIVPVMTNQGINVDVILEMIANMKRPERDLGSEPLMYIVRSFDVNKPSSDVTRLSGGVLGGAVVRGRFKKGDEIELRPGMAIQTGGGKVKKSTYKSIVTVITDISNGTDKLEEATPGGLVGVSTEVDPAFAKADGLVGNLVGHVGKLPESLSTMTISYHKLNRTDIQEQPIREGEPLLLGAGTATLIGYVTKARKDTVEMELKHPACIEKSAKIAIMRNIGQRWRLTGYGTLP